MLLKDRFVIITGCNKGIGRAVLDVSVKNGASIIACIRNPTDEFICYTDKLSKKYCCEIHVVKFDLTDHEQIKSAGKEIISLKKNIHALVNNAAGIQSSIFQMTSQNDIKEIFNINYFSQLLFTQYITKIMTKQKYGSIVNITSTAAIDGNKGRICYASSKAALSNATLVMSKELAPYNIRVNAIAPGLTDTDMMVENTSKEIISEVIDNVSMGRVGLPSEIANVALFLCSELSSYVTGQIIRVDGGM